MCVSGVGSEECQIIKIGQIAGDLSRLKVGFPVGFLHKIFLALKTVLILSSLVSPFSSEASAPPTQRSAVTRKRIGGACAGRT